MTLYAASHIAEFTVPAENGGCGQPHGRPVLDGAPQHPWQLNCPGCEDFLRKHNSDQWSTTVDEIPETHDEKTRRERAEKTGKLDRENQMASALIELAKLGQLPEAISRAFAQIAVGAGAASPPAVAGFLECPNGHASPAGSRFCGQCGQALSQPAPAAFIEPPPSAAKRRLRDARLDELQKLARDRQMDSAGTRSELIIRLSAAGVTSNDLNALAA